MAIKIKDKNGNVFQVAGVGKPGTPGQDGTSAYQAAVAGGYTGTEEDFNERMAKGVFVGTGTALATGWTGQQNTVAITGLPASVTGIVGVSGSAGDDAWQAAVAAVLRPVSQAAGSVTIKALGTPPDVDIPISVYYWPDTGSPVLLSMFPGTGEQIPLDAPTGFTGTAGNAQVTLTWTDPKDKYATPEGETTEEGDQLVSEWAYTRIIRKTGSAPTGPNDGVLVVESSVRDQYASTGYVDSDLTNGTTYYYGAYAYNKDGVASEGAVTEGITPKAGTPLSELTEGTLIKIMENGSPVWSCRFFAVAENLMSRCVLSQGVKQRTMQLTSWSPYLAVMEVVPAFTAVTTPFSSTVAMWGCSEVHSTASWASSQSSSS